MAKNHLPEPVNQNLNRISAGTKIVGTIQSTGDIRIDGYVEGNVTSSSKVVLGSTGQIKGDLLAKTADFLGTLDGNIVAEDTVTLKETATITGKLTTDKLIVENGAKFNGTCAMGGK